VDKELEYEIVALHPHQIEHLWAQVLQYLVFNKEGHNPLLHKKIRII